MYDRIEDVSSRLILFINVFSCVQDSRGTTLLQGARSEHWPRPHHELSDE